MAVETTELSNYPSYIQATIELAFKDESSLIQSDWESIAEEIIAVGCQKEGCVQSSIELVLKLCNIDICRGQPCRFATSMRLALMGCFSRGAVIRRSHGNWMRLLKFTFSVYQGLSETDSDLSDVVIEALKCTLRDLNEEDEISDKQNPIPDPSEVDFMVFTLQDYGKQLENSYGQEMEELFDLVRDHIIREKTEATIRQMLMEILEFRAFGWVMPEEVTNYYYGS